jgi:DNA mismatch repair protein PMS2
MSTSTIKPIDKSSIHQITSGQVVIDLQTAVKELLENSVDAGATNVGELFSHKGQVASIISCCFVEVRFKNFGLTSIEVIDNGSGIPENDHDSIGTRYLRVKTRVISV